MPHLPVWMMVYGGILMALHGRVRSHLRTLEALRSWRLSSLIGDEAFSVPKPAKQNGRSSGDHGSIWDSWPSFSGYPREPRVWLETMCPRHTASDGNPNLWTHAQEPSKCCSRSKHILLTQRRWKARKFPAVGKLLFLSFPFIERTWPCRGGRGHRNVPECSV